MIELKIILAAAIAVGGATAVVGYGHTRYNAGAASVQAKWNVERAALASAGRAAEAQARQVEQQRQAAMEQVKHDAQDQIDQADAAAAAARRTADGLRRDLAAYTARGRGAAGDPGAAGSGAGEQAADPLDLLADLFGRADDAAGALAGYADRLRITGAACEAAGDALR